MEYKSRTQKKKEARHIQDIGERLVRLSVQQLDSMNLPPRLHEQLIIAKGIKSHGAKRRQLQYIGALMRKIDIQPVADALQKIDMGNCMETAIFKETEKWRDALVSGNMEIMEEILGRFPGADRNKLLLLAGQSVREMKEGAPKGAARMLFRYLREIRDH